MGIASVATPDTILPAHSPGNSDLGGLFPFDGGTYQFNLKSDGLVAGTYYFYFIAAGDPVRHAVQFVIR